MDAQHVGDGPSDQNPIPGAPPGPIPAVFEPNQRYPINGFDNTLPEKTYLPLKPVLGGIIAVFLALIVGLAIAGRARDGIVSTQFDKYVGGDPNAQFGGFECDMPHGWSVENIDVSTNGFHGVNFSSGDAQIQVRLNPSVQVRSVLQFYANNGSGPTDMSSGNGTAILNESTRSARLGFLTGYHEDPPRALFGDPKAALVCEWTARGGIFGLTDAMHGYRVSEDQVLGIGLTFLCGCPQNQWEKMKPVFDHALSTASLSFERDGGGSTATVTLSSPDTGKGSSGPVNIHPAAPDARPSEPSPAATGMTPAQDDSRQPAPDEQAPAQPYPAQQAPTQPADQTQQQQYAPPPAPTAQTPDQGSSSPTQSATPAPSPSTDQPAPAQPPPANQSAPAAAAPGQ